MFMSIAPQVLLVVYVVVIFIASIIGGRLSEFGVLTHKRTQLAMSVVAGFILGIALFHLLPHSFDLVPGPNSAVNVMLGVATGMISMVILQRVFQFHQHDFSDESGVHRQGHDSDKGLVGIAIGLGLHAATEGFALGTSVRIGLLEAGMLPGLGVCLAILSHKPLDAFSITGMMKHRGKARKARLSANVGYALICPLAAVLSYFGTGVVGNALEGVVLGYGLAFAAGAFLCISLSDLLPEIHFHQHDRVPLLLALLVGISLAYILYLAEASASHGAQIH